MQEVETCEFIFVPNLQVIQSWIIDLINIMTNYQNAEIGMLYSLTVFLLGILALKFIVYYTVH